MKSSKLPAPSARETPIVNIISRCVKEAKESKFFLRLVVASEPELTEEARVLYREAKELHLIFASIYRK